MNKRLIMFLVSIVVLNYNHTNNAAQTPNTANTNEFFMIEMSKASKKLEKDIFKTCQTQCTNPSTSQECKKECKKSSQDAVYAANVSFGNLLCAAHSSAPTITVTTTPTKNQAPNEYTRALNIMKKIVAGKKDTNDADTQELKTSLTNLKSHNPCGKPTTCSLMIQMVSTIEDDRDNLQYIDKDCQNNAPDCQKYWQDFLKYVLEIIDIESPTKKNKQTKQASVSTQKNNQPQKSTPATKSIKSKSIKQ